MVIFVDGTQLNSSTVCLLDQFNNLMGNKSQLLLGADPIADVPFAGKFADVRFYSRKLNVTEVKEVRNFSINVATFTSILIYIQPKALASGVTFDEMSIDTLLSSAKQVQWLYVDSQQIFTDAKSVCTRFKGTMLDPANTNEVSLHAYVENVIVESVFEFWTNSSGKTCIVTSVTPSNVTSTSADCSSLYSTICIIDCSTVYKMVSNFKGMVNLSLIADSYVFDADYEYSIEYHKSKESLSLIESMTGDTDATIKYIYFNNILGRQEWTNSADQSHFEMTLSSCSSNEFTCSNGFCISLQKICDYVVDCADFTDEFFCNTTQKRPLYYDSYLSGVKVLNISVSINLDRILGLSMSDGTLQIGLTVVASWRDNRVVFHNIHAGNKTAVPSKDAVYYWQPDISLDGVISTDVAALSMATAPGDMSITADSTGAPTFFKSREGEDAPYFKPVFSYARI